MHTADGFFILIREGQHNRAALFKELAINPIKIGFQLHILPVAHTHPTSGMAVTAVDDRQVMFSVFNSQVIGKNQLRCF